MSLRSLRRSSLVTSAIVLILFVCLLSFSQVSPHASLAATQTTEQPTFHTQVAGKRSHARFVPGNVIVRYRDEAAAKTEQRAAAALRTDNGEQLQIRVENLAANSIVPGLRLAKVDPNRTLEAIAALKARPDVLYAEPDYIIHRDDLPNDPSFGQLYGLKNTGQSGGTAGADIHAQQAWDITHGSSNVVVGVVDEGIDINHPDLQANIWTNPGEIAGNGIDDDGNGFVDDVQGWDFIPCNLGDGPVCGDNHVYAGSPGDNGTDAHGTHVAGTIGAVGNNGVGVVGVNWQVKIMPLKFLGPTDGTTSDAIRAYSYAKLMRDLWVSTGGVKGANIRVLNNSYGGDGFAQSQSDAIAALNSSGILFVAAAGNDAVNTDQSPHYPSSYDLPNLISVAATDRADNISGFSNFGLSTVQLGAPGSSILSTTPNNTYSTFSGTSMASPHVAGAAALLLAKFPNLTVQQLRGLLLFNGDELSVLSSKTLTGRRLNVFNSLQAGAENDTTPPGTVQNLTLTSQQERTLSLQWTASGDDGASGRASLYDVSFVDAANPSAPISLAKLKPAVSGALQTVTAKIPLRHTSGNIRIREFDNVGNEGTPASLSISISADIADPYLVSETAPPGSLSTGTPLGLEADDKYFEGYALPFSFNFYGQVYTSVTISTNGALYFSTPPKRANGDADDVPSAISGLNSQKMIAGLWDDLRTDARTGDDVYVSTPDLNRIIFRWQAVTFGDGTPSTEFPVNFEIELRRDGSIITRYGSGNTNIFPVVGISGGEPDAYSVNSHTSETSPTALTNAQTVNFVLRPPLLPAIDSNGLSPSSATVGGGAFTLTVNGANFVSDSVVRWNDSNRMTTFVSSTQLTAQITTTDIASPGTVAVTVFNPSTGGGTSSLAVALTINNPVPTSSNISPTSVTAGDPAFTLTVNGSNFVNGSVVRVNNADRTTIFVNNSRLTAQVTAADIESAGTLHISVFNPTPGGGSSNFVDLSVVGPNPVPTLSSISPSSKIAGDAAFTLTVNGSRFVSNSVVRWNGSDRPTAFVSSNQLTAQISAADIATPATVQVAVFNPTPSGGLAAAQTFIINKPPASVQFSIANYSLPEGGSVQVTVNRTGDTSTAVTVNYATSDTGPFAPCTAITGSASQYCDYEITGGTLSFAANETSKTLTPLSTDDAYVEGNETLTLTLSRPVRGILGAASTAMVTIIDNDTAPPTSNPIDDARTFIRTHYLDFLNREPDQSGWDYWTGQITQCGTDQTCIHNQRIGISAAFYIELEFQKTGSVIYRMYRASYGVLQNDPLVANISYTQFSQDRPLINPDPAQIQQSTIDFANQFVQRTQFKSAYPNTMTNTEFVNKLYDTASLSPYTTERQAQVTAMQGGKTRAQVLLDVIEISEFKNREFNRGFVLMQYFGYLRRDVDTGGYDFWLDVLNNRLPPPNNFRNMVCAFLTSDEYQKRFSSIISRHNSNCSSN